MIKQAQQSFTFHHFGQLLFQNRRKAGMYGLLLIVISFNLCLFLRSIVRGPAAEVTVNAIQVSCFGLMGILNTWFFYKRKFLDELSLSGARLAFICLLFIMIAVVLFVYYYVSGNNGLIMAFASSSAFLLPFLFYQGWTEFIAIPQKEFTAWYLPPEDNAERNIVSSAANTLQVHIKISRKSGDRTNIFPMMVPARQKLGRVFENFIAEQNNGGKRSVIDIKNADQQSFGWRFYEERWHGLYSRDLNPVMMLVDNKIRRNATIRIERIDISTREKDN